MVSQFDALVRLNEEKAYEDKLAKDLSEYFIVSLDNIQDLTNDERDLIRKYLNVIMNDSLRHSAAFNQLVQMVYEHGDADF
jgi:hypothetical protein